MRRIQRTWRRSAWAVAAVLVLASCGDDGGSSAESPSPFDGVDGVEGIDVGEMVDEMVDDILADGVGAEGIDLEGLIDDPAGVAEDLVDSLENQQASQGGGSATIVIDGREWSFDSVLCAFGPEEIGQEGAELVLSSVQDGLQLYASIDVFGHSLSLDDITDFENPSVSYSTVGEGFIELSGKSASATAEFRDYASDDPFESLVGEFEATCP